MKFDDALVRIEQTFDAPRDQVFDAWVQQDLLEEWFAPDGCTLHIARLDVREGGGYHWCVKNPSFGECWTIGSYLEVVRPERLVFTATIADADGIPRTPAESGTRPGMAAGHDRLRDVHRTRRANRRDARAGRQRAIGEADRRAPELAADAGPAETTLRSRHAMTNPFVLLLAACALSGSSRVQTTPNQQPFIATTVQQHDANRDRPGIRERHPHLLRSSWQPRRDTPRAASRRRLDDRLELWPSAPVPCQHPPGDCTRGAGPRPHVRSRSAVHVRGFGRRRRRAASVPEGPASRSPRLQQRRECRTAGRDSASTACTQAGVRVLLHQTRGCAAAALGVHQAGGHRQHAAGLEGRVPGGQS